MDFQFELGKTLDGTLRRFQKQDLSPASLLNEGVDYRIALETFFALYNRGYIANVDFSVNQKTYESAYDIDLGDEFRITVEGRDFIELYRAWWTRFWFRSIACPVIVSFITAVNAVHVWNVFKGIWRLLLSP